MTDDPRQELHEYCSRTGHLYWSCVATARAQWLMEHSPFGKTQLKLRLRPELSEHGRRRIIQYVWNDVNFLKLQTTRENAEQMAVREYLKSRDDESAV